MNFLSVAKDIMAATKKHAPELLIGMGIGGMFTAMVSAVKASPKMYEDLEKVKENKEMTKKERQKEEVKTVVKHQIPAIVIFAVSLLAIVSADSIHYKRNAAMAVVVQASEAAAKEYKNIVAEVAGEEKAREVERVYEERTRAEPQRTCQSQPVNIITGDEFWIKDSFTNIIFKSNINTINAAVNECNRRMFDEMYISLSEFYEEIGITDAKINKAVGWNNNIGMIKISWDVVIEGNKPVVVMIYSNQPREGFKESW